MEYMSDALGVTAVQLVNELFNNAVGYRNYRDIEKSARYDNKVASELSKMDMNATAQMKSRTLYGMDPLSIAFFFQKFKLSWGIGNIHKGQRCGYVNIIYVARSDHSSTCVSNYRPTLSEHRMAAYRFIL